MFTDLFNHFAFHDNYVKDGLKQAFFKFQE